MPPAAARRKRGRCGSDGTAPPGWNSCEEGAERERRDHQSECHAGQVIRWGKPEPCTIVCLLGIMCGSPV